MGLFSSFMKSIKVAMGSFFGFQTHSAPFDREAWYHDTFRATVDAIASHGAKGEFQAVIFNSEGRIKKIIRNDPMARLLNVRPNEIMSGTEFKYRMIANLETKTTAIAYIRWDGTKPAAIYPVDYANYEFKRIKGEAGLAIEFTTYEGETMALPLECCVVMRKFYNERLASGDGNEPIYKVLDMSKASDEGFIESLQVSNKIKGIVKQKRAMLDPADVKKGQETFVDRLMEASKKGGIVAVDSMEDFTPITVDAKSANAAQMQYINNRIYTYLRTPEDIVQNKYSEQVGMAWQQGKIEPIWNIFAEAVTAVYYTKHEIECGNRMIMTGMMTMGMSVNSIVQILNATKETGELTTNERRELLGRPPVEDGDVRQISLNFVTADNQNNYQKGGKDDGKSDDSGTGTGNTGEETQGNE